ncbi:MAG: HU family DNA-binding protein [Spirochaetes bacterium]|nr:HU family DNA-binding protein [Spirochaetota bacterium]
MRKDKVGEITIPGIAKFHTVVKPAVPERKGINPFTKEPMIFKAKPARRVIKVKVLKALKRRFPVKRKIWRGERFCVTILLIE